MVTTATDRSAAEPVRRQRPSGRDLSVQSNAASSRVVLNVLEAFFKHPLLYVLPIGVLFILGVAVGLGGDKEYRSVGILNVTSDSPIADLTDSANVPQFGYESPATVTSRQINDLLGTRQFIDSVIEQAGLTTAVENGALTRDDVASSVGASPAGDNLVRVASTTSQPEMSQRLAAGTVAAFINQIVDSDSGNISVRIDVYNDQLQEAKDRLAAAQKALDDFVEANPSPTDGQPRPDTEAATFTRLNDNVDAASSQVDNIQASLDNATLTSELTLTDVQQRLSLIDEPEVPTVPEPRMRKAAMTAVMFGAFGAVISIAVVALAAALDRTVRVPADITERFRLDVLAVLPASRR